MFVSFLGGPSEPTVKRKKICLGEENMKTRNGGKRSRDDGKRPRGGGGKRSRDDGKRPRGGGGKRPRGGGGKRPRGGGGKRPRSVHEPALSGLAVLLQQDVNFDIIKIILNFAITRPGLAPGTVQRRVFEATRALNQAIYSLSDYWPCELWGHMDDAGNMTVTHTLLSTLPVAFAQGVVDGSLTVCFNSKLRSLCPNFGSIRVGKGMHLNMNELESLPDSFGDVGCIDGELYLSCNRLQSLPDSFCRLTVKGDLRLQHNQLRGLPARFHELTVSGEIRLHNNMLVSLPESFGQLKVAGNLHLCDNHLQSLPESFGQLNVGGDLHLCHNHLRSLPESFGNLVVHGSLRLHHNPLLWDLPDNFFNVTVGGDLVLPKQLSEVCRNKEFRNVIGTVYM